ncbi:division/cell wall cluster transcriptional repressor MraZ [Sphingomonas alpina]|uniref:Division/cell wall cluster transcriptional repressor MraZ n=1 Tax=Sphingomonas alpina TaxID=653931 RepID=A0A7H0LG31_9SPHN|nr:division/cell wall cluster transcriptional repressor MraZ [Sphingomonas alpina]QNQ08634.1 division/cell wall cluster transcriptional repressor MraZ [Sphingomonas alpina]
MDEPFFGSAVCDVTGGGHILLPPRFGETIRLRSPDQRLFIGLHEDAQCLVAFDRRYAMQRPVDDEAGGMSDAHRLRRTYGFVESTLVAPDGMIAMPALMRERGHIGHSVLLVATGQRFEIWDLVCVLKRGPSDLITLATHHLMAHIGNEVLHVPALSSVKPRPGARRAAQSGVCLQPVPAMQPRHDPIGRGAAGN